MIKPVKKRTFRQDLVFVTTSGCLQNPYLRHILWFTRNQKETNYQQVYHQQRRDGVNHKKRRSNPSPKGGGGAVLDKMSAPCRTAQWAAWRSIVWKWSGVKPKKEERRGGLLVLFKYVSPRMGVGETLSTVHSQTVSIMWDWQMCLP